VFIDTTRFKTTSIAIATASKGVMDLDSEDPGLVGMNLPGSRGMSIEISL
jgi:hypothetical protein